MQNIKVVNQNYEALIDAITRAEALAAKPQLTPQEVRMHATLLSKISLLKNGIDERTVNAAQLNSMRREIGLKDDSPIPVSTDQREYWNACAEFVRSGKVPRTEFRTSGQQYDMWGRVSGLTYLGGDTVNSGITDEGIAGGFLTPPEYLTAQGMFQALASVDDIVDAASGYSNPIVTETGGSCVVPVADDSTAASSSPVVYGFVGSVNTRDAFQIAQNSQRQSFKMSSAQFGAAYSYRTAVACAIELAGYPSAGAGDSFTSFMQLAMQVFNQRHSVSLGRDMCVGAGPLNGQPLGILTAIKASTTVPNANATSNLTSLAAFHAALLNLPKGYRKDAVWGMSTSAWLAVSELLESENRPDLNSFGDGKFLLGRRVGINDDFPEWQDGNLGAVVYNPRFVLQRRVKQSGMYLSRAFETPGFAEQGEVLIQSTVRFDSLPLLYNSIAPPYSTVSVEG